MVWVIVMVDSVDEFGHENEVDEEYRQGIDPIQGGKGAIV